jgi:hypothetical protein
MHGTHWLPINSSTCQVISAWLESGRWRRTMTATVLRTPELMPSANGGAKAEFLGKIVQANQPTETQ